MAFVRPDTEISPPVAGFACFFECPKSISHPPGIPRFIEVTLPSRKDESRNSILRVPRAVRARGMDPVSLFCPCPLELSGPCPFPRTLSLLIGRSSKDKVCYFRYDLTFCLKFCLCTCHHRSNVVPTPYLFLFFHRNACRAPCTIRHAHAIHCLAMPHAPQLMMMHAVSHTASQPCR